MAKIRNRDIPLLGDVKYIMQLVRRAEERRDWQRDRMENITAKLTGMPGGGRRTSGLEEGFAMLSELDEQQADRVKEYVLEMKEAERVLNAIPHPDMRAFALLKYCLDIPDREIAEELDMSEWAVKLARRRIEEAPEMSAVIWPKRCGIVKETKTT